MEEEEGKIFRSREVRRGERVGRCLLGMGERRVRVRVEVEVGVVRDVGGEEEGFVGGVWFEGLFFVLFFMFLFRLRWGGEVEVGWWRGCESGKGGDGDEGGRVLDWLVGRRKSVGLVVWQKMHGCCRCTW